MKGGFTGMIDGVGKGLVGFFTKPVSGLFDMGASMVSGARKAIDGNQDVIDRLRLPRAYPMGCIDYYREKESQVQFKVRGYDVRRGTQNEKLWACLEGELKGSLVAVCDRRIFVLQDNEVTKCVDIYSIKDISCDQNHIMIEGEDRGEEVVIQCLAGSDEEAEDVVGLIRSRRSFVHMFALTLA